MSLQCRVLELTESEGARIADLAESLRYACEGSVSYEPTIEEVAEIVESMPRRLRIALLSTRLKETPVTIVRNVPISTSLPPTPSSWRDAAEAGAGRPENNLLLLMSHLLGEPFAWATSQEGRLVHDVLPVRGEESGTTNASSKAALSLHTEDVFHSARGDYVALLCLRNPQRVATTVATVTESIAQRTLLRSESFRFYADDVHIEPREHTPPLSKRATDRGPVLFGPPTDPYIRFDIDFTGAVGQEGEMVIEELNSLLTESATEHVLEPGDFVAIDNFKCLHGRTAFEPMFNGHDRWLKRCNIARDLRRARISSSVRGFVVA